MPHALYLKKIAINVHHFVMKQSSILTSIQKFTVTVLAKSQNSTDEKDGSGNWPMNIFLDTIKVHQY
jgi:hypothetical protein